MGQADTARDMEEELTSPRRPVRTVGEEAKKRLGRYCEFWGVAHIVADIYKCLPILQIIIRKPKAWPRRNEKRLYVGPFAKRMQVESPELTEADSKDGELVGQMTSSHQ